MTKNMARTNRRDVLRAGLAFVAFPYTTILDFGCKSDQKSTNRNAERSPDNPENKNENDIGIGEAMKIQYLEIVTTDIETICSLYTKMLDVTFGDPEESLGGAHTARLANGGTLGIRAPMHDGEKPVVRPYILVEDIEAAVAAAADAGAEIAVPPMEIAGYGTCAILIKSGIESGLWQL